MIERGGPGRKLFGLFSLLRHLWARMAQKSAGRSARGRLGSSEIQLEPKTDGVLLGNGLWRFRHSDKACEVEGRDSGGMPKDGGEVLMRILSKT